MLGSRFNPSADWPTCRNRCSGHRPSTPTASRPAGRMRRASPPIPCLARPTSAFRSMWREKAARIWLSLSKARALNPTRTLSNSPFVTGQSPDLTEATKFFTTAAWHLHQDRPTGRRPVDAAGPDPDADRAGGAVLRAHASGPRVGPAGRCHLRVEDAFAAG